MDSPDGPRILWKCFAGVVSAVCHALTVKRDNCPLTETQAITSASSALDFVESQLDICLDSTGLSIVEWANGKSTDVNIRNTASPKVSKYFREWSKLSACNNVFIWVSCNKWCNLITCQLVLSTRFIVWFYSIYMMI